MAHTKSGGSTSLGRDSVSKRLGVKRFGGQNVKKGQIIVRQKGTKFRPGKGTKKGNDHTIFAIQDGIVQFYKKKVKKFTGKLQKATFINIVK